MAETHHKPETHTPITRCYTVGYVSDANYRPVPAVMLKGHWLAEAGFDTGRRWSRSRNRPLNRKW